MSKKKAKDNKSDCIFRYKDASGQWVCSNYGYKTSDECIKYFGWYPFKSRVSNGKLEYSGGFILNGDAIITKCRSCKYYCNDIQQYINRVNYLNSKYK